MVVRDNNSVTLTRPDMFTTKSLWERLTQAPASITDREERHRNRLLSAIMLVMVVVGSIAIGFTAVIQQNAGLDSDIIATLVTIIVTLLLYGLNRQGKTQLAATLFTGITFILFAFVPFMEGSADAFMIGAILPIAITGLYANRRVSMYVALGMTIVQLLLLIQQPANSIRNYAYTWAALLVVYALFITFIRHQQTIERIRQAALLEVNEKLRKSETTLEERVADRTRDLEVVSDMSKQVAGMLNLDTMLNYTVEHVSKTFNWYSVSVYLYDAEAGTLNYHAGSMLQDQTLMDRLLAMPMDEISIITHAANIKDTVQINDISQSMLSQHPSSFEQTQSELAIPMMIRGELIGVLDIQSIRANEFDASAIKTMTSLSEQLAVAVQTATLYTQQVTTTEKLREVDHLKSQFLASMSHELRTPLNAILNFTEFVSLGMFGPVNDAQKDALGKSLDSGRHLLSLINDVLDITKIESGNMTLFIEEDVDVTAEINQICATAETLLERKRDAVAFVMDIEDNLPQLIGDRRRIRQILLNIISNAIKFTEEGHVTFSARREEDHILFAVIDTGSGIAPHQHLSIFEPFIQTETGIKHEGGTGLGLPITKRLVEAHNGQITLESEPGKGTTFYIRLPIHSEELKEQLQTSTVA